MKKIILLFLLAFANNSLATEFINGAELLNDCSQYIEDDYSTNQLCPAFIAGIASVHETLVNWGGHRREWCIPEEVDINGLVTAVFQDMILQSPKTLIYRADSLVAFSLVKLFPCQ